MLRKITVWIFQATNWLDCMQEDLGLAKKRKSHMRNWVSSNSRIKKKNNAIRTKYIKVKIDNTQQNNGLWREKDETVYYIIRDSSKLEKWCSRVSMAGWEMLSAGNSAKHWNSTIVPNGICTNQNLLHKILRHRILCGFEIQADHPIPTRTSDLINQKKSTCHQVDLVVAADHWVKMKDRKSEDKYLELARELESSCRKWGWRSYQL